MTHLLEPHSAPPAGSKRTRGGREPRSALSISGIYSEDEPRVNCATDWGVATWRVKGAGHVKGASRERCVAQLWRSSRQDRQDAVARHWLPTCQTSEESDISAPRCWRASPHAKCPLEPQLVRRHVPPAIAPKGLTALRGPADRREFGLGQGLVHTCEPVGGSGCGPLAARQSPWIFGVQAGPSTPPRPGFRTLNEPGAHAIAFNVPAHCVEVLATLHRKRLERSLVDVPFTFTVMSLLPATQVRRRQLVHEGRNLVVQFRPQYEMPVLWGIRQ